MAIITQRVTVTTSPVMLSPEVPDNANSYAIAFTNTGAGEMFFGGDDVTTSNGIALAAGSSASFDVTADELIYAVTASGSTVASVIATGV